MWHILYVEDDENDVLLIRLALVRLAIPFTLHVARDGGEAIDYLAGNGRFGDRRMHPAPHLILLDAALPKCSGYEVLLWVRSHPDQGEIPVVFFSSWSLRQDIELAYQLGANSYMLKPTNPADLEPFLSSVLGFWIKANKNQGEEPVLPQDPPPPPRSVHWN
jgi:CheY-like chemotaxis protein